MQQPAKHHESEDTLNPLDLERMYEDHADFVRALLARLLGNEGDPDDLTQEVFLVALSRHPGCVLSPRGWLCQIAVKLAAGTRRRARFRRALRVMMSPAEADRRTPEVVAEAREATRRVYAVLDAMPEKKRTVFILFEMMGLGGQEIADSLGIPLRTVHTRLFHARREFVAAYPDAPLRQGENSND